MHFVIDPLAILQKEPGSSVRLFFRIAKRSIKNLFQFDETQVLIASVVKLILYYFNSINFGPSWLLSVDSPVQLVVRSIRTFLKQVTGLKTLFKTLKGLPVSPFK